MISEWVLLRPQHREINMTIQTEEFQIPDKPKRKKQDPKRCS